MPGTIYIERCGERRQERQTLHAPMPRWLLAAGLKGRHRPGLTLHERFTESSQPCPAGFDDFATRSRSLYAKMLRNLQPLAARITRSNGKQLLQRRGMAAGGSLPPPCPGCLGGGSRLMLNFGAIP